MIVVSTAYFPSISSVEAIADGEALIEAHETFQKHSDRNRCRVMTADGVRLLSVPVIGGRGVRLPIREVEVDYTLPFERDHLRTIEAAYRGAAYFEHFFERIEPLFRIKEQYLFDLNCRITSELLAILKKETTLRFTDQFQGATGATFNKKPYFQVFGDRQPFTADLSVLDWIFCCGYL